MFDKILDKFSKTKKFISKELLYSFYNIVSQEIQQGIKDEGVWAKSFADAQGDEQKTKAIYIDLMVERLILKHEAELELKKNFLPSGKINVGITSGASTPDKVVADVIEKLIDITS